MTDYDLSRLKELPVPLPREGAKTAAVDAALEAYSQAAANLSEQAQGSPAPRRPTNASPTAERSRPMRFRLPIAIAATVAAIAIAVPVALHLTKGRLIRCFSSRAPPPRAPEQRASS